MDFFGVIGAMGAAEGAYYAFDTSDRMGQAIVLLLLVGSVATWSIMLDKWLSLRRAQKLSERFISRFRHAGSITSAQLYKDASTDPGPVARVYASGAEKLLDFYGTNGPARPLTVAQREAIRTVLDNSVSDQILALEERVPFLALAVSVSPFCGLFGTVWGVMLAFCGAAKAGRADIAELAPGVAGALLTTVVGLVVAIPSLIGYNILTGSIRQTTVYMDNFVEEFMTRLGLEQLEVEEQQKRNEAAARPAAPAMGGYEEAQVVMPLKSVLAASRQPQSTPVTAQPEVQATAANRPAEPVSYRQPVPETPASPLQPRVVFEGREAAPDGDNAGKPSF